MRLKKKLLVVLALAIVGVLTLLCFKPFAKTNIIVLDHLTENHDGTIDQIYLVLNEPSHSKKLSDLISEFNRNTPSENVKYNKTFIKQHDYIFLPSLTLSKNIDYMDETVTRNDIDNIDILGRSTSLMNKSGKRINSLEINIGGIWYYKE